MANQEQINSSYRNELQTLNSENNGIEDGDQSISQDNLLTQLKKFFDDNSEICATCKRYAKQPQTIITKLSSPKRNPNSDGKRSLWEHCIRNWEINEGPVYVMENGKPYSFLKINRSARCKTELSDGLEQPIIQQPSSSNNFFKFPLKTQGNSLKITPLTHISFRKTIGLCCGKSCRHQYICLRQCCHCYHYSHHAVILHKSHEVASKENNQNSKPVNKYHLIDSWGHIYCGCCSDKDILSEICCKKKEHEELNPDPCWLCPCKCYTRSAVTDLSHDDFDVVIYKEPVAPLQTLQTLIEKFNDDVCCICAQRRKCCCCSCYSFDECPGYCLCFNNCEHQAVKSKIGVKQSHQVNEMVNQCCIRVNEIFHNYLPRFLLLTCAIFELVDAAEDFPLAVDLFMFITSWIAVCFCQLINTIKIIREHKWLNNGIPEVLIKWKYYSICIFRITLFLIYSALAICK